MRCLGVLAIAVLASSLAAQLNWQRVATSGPRHTLSGIAFDSARDRVVLFGGDDSTRATDATWEFDGTTWRQLTLRTRPAARARPAMVYDAARGVVVMFGGWTGSAYLNDTWTWNGTSWTRMQPTTVPTARSASAMAYDSARKVVVMFGGWSTRSDLNDTWEWNGTNWTSRSTSTRPGVRGAHRMAFDKKRGVTLLMGGFNTPTRLTVPDTWEWNGSSWTEHRTTTPGNRCDQVMDYDAARNRVCLFGGFRVTSSTRFQLGETWDFDGKAWQKRQTFEPSPRSENQSVYDSKRNRLVVYGGRTSATSIATDTYVLVPAKPASLTPYGQGCAGSAGVPALRGVPDQLPWLGERFDLEVSGAAPASTAGLILLGFSDKKWGALNLPLDMAPFGAAGCPVNTSVEVLSVMTLSGGKGVIPAFTCNCPVIVGQPFYMQVMVIDVGVSRFLKVAATNGVRVIAGQR